MEEKERDRIVAKIRALQAKTQANGCSEQEAMAAAAKAVELLTAYNIGQTELDIQEASHRDLEIDIGVGKKAGVFHPVQMCASAIGRATDTIPWRSSRPGQKVLKFFGEPQDLAVADYLVALIRRAMDTEFDRFQTRQGAMGYPAHKPSFMNAMADRICDRLDAMKAEQRAAMTGRALMVVKTQAVARAFAKHGPKLRTTTQRVNVSDVMSYAAGQAAGDRVSLNRGVAGGSNAARLR
jgi:hypothetical protein